MAWLRAFFDFFAGDLRADGIVPARGHTAWLVFFAAATMAFLAVFALAIAVAAGRLANTWSQEMAQSVTVIVDGPQDQRQAQTDAALRVLETTEGVASARALTPQEQRDLLSPWFGDEIPIENLAIPQLIEVIPAPQGFDAEGLVLRLQGEAPNARFDDHSAWRDPLVRSARGLRILAAASLVLILATAAAIVSLGAKASLAGNFKTISVLRRIGAKDAFIAKVFVRRFTLRTLTGAGAGALIATITVAFLPSAAATAGFLTGIGFTGLGWLLPLMMPLLFALIAFAATRTAALRLLQELT
ncbi:cell division protein FtsX [Pseudaestuariivita rosea]|uniref:cell division protein FtsX n=1 Tax=Pseudaestuariivita rosea TaxID=2763263 RepID=UPI001ABBD4FE|nr:cell division protein FtsX [Pseudaestuariivita rosea]